MDNIKLYQKKNYILEKIKRFNDMYMYCFNQLDKILIELQTAKLKKNSITCLLPGEGITINRLI